MAAPKLRPAGGDFGIVITLWAINLHRRHVSLGLQLAFRVHPVAGQWRTCYRGHYKLIVSNEHVPYIEAGNFGYGMALSELWRAYSYHGLFRATEHIEQMRLA